MSVADPAARRQLPFGCRHSGPIFRWKGDIRNFGCHAAMKLLEYGMKVVKRALGKGFCSIMTINEMQFSFMPERGAIDAMFILRRLQEEYHSEGKKLCMCFGGSDERFWQCRGKC